MPEEKDELKEQLGDYKSALAEDMKLTVELDRDLIFVGRTNRGYEIDFDALVEWGCMPTEGLLASAAGCMAIDVVSFLRKMRCEIKDFKIETTGHRNPTPPQYFTGMDLHIKVSGSGITEKKMQRAVSLSKDKYCSVYHSLRPDIEHKVTWEVTGG
ncbi:MAG TPA: OsmC family peroxiredoxin [Nitrospirae bacterium]|nr:OsmC family peroxiredoxin [Nitrospirota bacterium]